MKRLVYILILCLTFSSCTSIESVFIDNSSLLGKWNWTSTTGGINGNINHTPTSLGKTVQIIFAKDYTFSILEDGQEVSKGNYNLEIGENNRDSKISYSGNYKKIQGVVLLGVYYFHSNNELIISDGYADGIASAFSKVQ